MNVVTFLMGQIFLIEPCGCRNVIQVLEKQKQKQNMRTKHMNF